MNLGPPDYESILISAVFQNANRWSEYGDGASACPAGYHVPNQRELLIMSTRLPHDAWETFTYKGLFNDYSAKTAYMCSTGFSMVGTNGYTTARQTFIWHPEDNYEFRLQDRTNETGYVRCVRDLQ